MTAYDPDEFDRDLVRERRGRVPDPASIRSEATRRGVSLYRVRKERGERSDRPDRLIALHLPQDVYQQIKDLADADERPLSPYIARLVRSHLSDQQTRSEL